MSDKLRVAIVDDTPDMRLLVRLSLELDPHIEVIAEAEDGRGAIDIARRHRPEVMLLDLAMPVMDGMQALPEVVRASPDTAILVLSGFSASAMAQDAISAGAKGYLQKGLGAEELCERVWEASGREKPPVGLEDLFTLPTEPDAHAQLHDDGRARADLAVVARAAEASPGGLAVLGVPAGEAAADGRFRYLNPQARTLLGLDEDPVGERLGDLVPGLAPLVDDLTAPGATPGTPARLSTDVGPVTVCARRSGDEVVLAVVPAGSGAEVERADAEVRRLRAAISRTAHELRTPVTVIVGLSDAAQASDGRIPDEKRREMRQALLRQSSVLERLTSDLETAAQVQRGSLAVTLEPVDVVQVVRSCLQHLGDETSFTILAEQEVSAHADPARLTQIVTNLVTNAQKYADPPYEVHVARRDDQVHLTVADRGEGVPEDFRPLLFEEFTRAQQDGRGTGLGLYVVRSLAEALGGAVDHQPRHGGGSLFTVRLRAL